MGAAGKLAVWLDHRFGWYRLPKPLGILVLAELRDLLRDKNLHDTGQPMGLSVPHAADDPETARYLTGSFAVPTDGGGNGDGASRAISPRGRSTAPTTTSRTR